MIIVVMGVAGCGKTSVGTLLAARLGWQFADADEFHQPANVEKMSVGIPLTDADREPWLEALLSHLRELDRRGQSAVLASSSLRRQFRARLAEAAAELRFVYLRTSPALIAERLRRRTNHFFDPVLLQSQFDTLEEPDEALVIDAAQPVDEIVRRIEEAISPQN